MACSSSGEPGVRPALTPEQLKNPNTCKECHPKHYEEWSASMHAYATKDPVFRAMNKRGQEETNGALGAFCVNCHAPMAVRDNMISNYADVEDLPEQYQGVTCYFCHNAVSVGQDHVNADVMIAEDNTMRAAINGPLIPSVHKVQHSINHDHDNMASSLMCGTCHDLVTPAHVALERTLQEYLTTFLASNDPSRFQSCENCHMDVKQNAELVAQSSGIPGVLTHARDVHDHLFPAVDVPLSPSPHSDALRMGVECELQRSISYFSVDLKQFARFSVSFETQAGHAQPSGASQDRRLWLEVVGYDNDNKQIYSAGVVPDGQLEEPPGTKHPCMLHDRTEDANGNPAHMFWDIRKVDSPSFVIPAPTTPTQGSHTQTCSFTPPLQTPIPRLEFRMRMRPIGLDVLQDLVASGHLSQDVVAQMPTLDVMSFTATLDPATNRYSVVNNTAPDCLTYKCMLDPDGQDCSPAALASAASAGSGAMAAGVGAAAGVGTAAGVGAAGVGMMSMSVSAAGAPPPMAAGASAQAAAGVGASAAGAAVGSAGVGVAPAAGSSAAPAAGTAGVAGAMWLPAAGSGL